MAADLYPTAVEPGPPPPRLCEEERRSLRASIVHSAGNIVAMSTFELGIDTDQRQRYRQLADTLYASYIMALDDCQRTAIAGREAKNGFRTVCDILSLAPAAYLAHCRSTSKNPHLEEMVAALKASPEVPDLFTGMGHEANYIYEEIFSLREYRDEATEPFVFVDQGNGTLSFKPNSMHQEVAAELCEGIEPSLRPSGTCIARGKFITGLWLAAIDSCAASPQLFAIDLAI